MEKSNEPFEVSKDGKTERRKDEKTERRKDGRTERRKDRKTERRKDGKKWSKDGQKIIKFKVIFLTRQIFIFLRFLSFDNFKFPPPPQNVLIPKIKILPESQQYLPDE